jgi:hypothetical protein
MAEENWVGQIGKELERIFRYLLPGIIVVGFARLSHPSWFFWVHPDNAQHLILLAAISLCLGSSWYVAHRYSLHQLLDWLFYISREGGKFGGYADWLAKHVAASLRSKGKDAELRHNSGLRSAQIIYMFVTTEAGLLFSLTYPDPSSFFGRHRCCIAISASAIFIVALVQQWLCYKIDLYAVESAGKASGQ